MHGIKIENGHFHVITVNVAILLGIYVVTIDLYGNCKCNS